LPRLVPNRKRAQSDLPVDEETDDSDHPPAVAHPYPHTRLTVLESFNYYRGDTLLRRFVKDEAANANDPLVIKAWGDYPHLFAVEHVS
jgi:hypothetical protein